MAFIDTADARTVRVSGPGRGSMRRALREGSVRVEGIDSTFPDVAGRFIESGDELRFRAAYPFQAGRSYRIRLPLSSSRCDGAVAAHTMWDTVLSIPPARAVRATMVTEVFPTAGVLPMNLLKFYVHFSGPMRRGDAARALRLVDVEADTVIPDAFFRLEDELWDPAQTRLTVLFDPARIKRGLLPNRQLGLPLRDGRRYRLEVDTLWLDANGLPLRRGFRKEFDVIGADRVPPVPDTWPIGLPRAATRDAVTLSFGEPMESALLERMIRVRSPSGTLLDGELHVEAGERAVRFVPHEPWRDGEHAFVIDALLEDLAGNNLRRLFDAEVGADATATPRGNTVEVRFRPHPADGPAETATAPAPAHLQRFRGAPAALQRSPWS